MSSDLKPILITVGVVAVIILAVIALRGVTVETVIAPSVEAPPPGDQPNGDPVAVVVSLQERQDSSFFGLVRGDTHHLAAVGFYAPAACGQLVTFDDAWPVAADECAAGVAISGPVTGLGTSASGETYVVVETEVSPECYATLEPGASWPVATGACAAGDEE